MLHEATLALPPPPLPTPDDALFLDFDGTLVELVERPDLVRVEDELKTLVRRLAARLGGRVALVSGRPAAEIRGLFGEVAVPIGGSHGIEIDRLGGRLDGPEPPAALAEVAARFDAIRARAPGTLIERKPYGVTFHFRGAPALEAEATALATSLAQETGLAVQPGKMMVELKLGGIDKGHAVAAFLSEPPMQGARPWFVGDDLTDEPAFAACARLGGAGVLVGDERPTEACFRLPDVSATLAWLEQIAARDEA